MHISTDTLTIAVGVAALVMVIREIIKIVVIGGMVAKYGNIRFRASYWLHMLVTIALVVWFVLLVTGRATA